MKRFVGGVFALLLVLPAMRGQDDPKKKDPNKPATPAEQVIAIQKEFADAQAEISKQIREAKTQDERVKASQESQKLAAKFLPRYVELAENNAKDPAAFDALSAAVMMGVDRAEPKLRKKVVDLLKEHAGNAKVGPIVQRLTFGYDADGATFLKAVSEKNPDNGIKVDALVGLAQRYQQTAMLLDRIKDNPSFNQTIDNALGKETGDYIRSSDKAKLESEVTAIYSTVAEKYIGELKPDRVAQMFQQMSFGYSKSNETFLRAIVAKDAGKEITAMATVTLAGVLKEKVSTVSEEEGKKVAAEAEKLYEAAEKFNDVKFGFRGTVGEMAKKELFDIRHLGVGKPAPEIDGVDQDGKSFKLSDYKGKVVFLDFWNEF